MEKKIGIITFHNSYNCGSMLQTYALQYFVYNMLKIPCEIIDFSNEGQQELYSIFQKNNNIKNIIKNMIIFPHFKKIQRNYLSFEEFKVKNFRLSKQRFSKMEELSDDLYNIVIAGSDQVWNITIADGDDAYFLPWVKNAKKIAYAPSFGARNVKDYSDNPNKYIRYLKEFEALSIREKNGQKWIKELIDKEVPVLLDPTLLLHQKDYSVIVSQDLKLPNKYIFYYSPGYVRDINNLVKKISNKYKLPVIAFNAKTFYTKAMNFSGFSLPEIENPTTYLQLIKNAEMIITTSFHGTIFSMIYRKKFWTVKNGDMFGKDDRVLTLMETLDLKDRLISVEYDPEFDYMLEKNYAKSNSLLIEAQQRSIEYLKKVLEWNC